MRWNAEKPNIPENGERKTLTKFAWKKTKVENKWVWLEFYLIDMQYSSPAGGGPGWWSEIGKRFSILG